MQPSHDKKEIAQSSGINCGIQKSGKSRARVADYKSGKKVVAKLIHEYISQKSDFVPKKGSFL